VPGEGNGVQGVREEPVWVQWLPSAVLACGVGRVLLGRIYARLAGKRTPKARQV